LYHFIHTGDKTRPILSTKSPGRSDYINAVFIDVSRTSFILPSLYVKNKFLNDTLTVTQVAN